MERSSGVISIPDPWSFPCNSRSDRGHESWHKGGFQSRGHILRLDLLKTSRSRHVSYPDTWVTLTERLHVLRYHFLRTHPFGDQLDVSRSSYPNSPTQTFYKSEWTLSRDQRNDPPCPFSLRRKRQNSRSLTSFGGRWASSFGDPMGFRPREESTRDPWLMFCPFPDPRLRKEGEGPQISWIVVRLHCVNSLYECKSIV